MDRITATRTLRSKPYGLTFEDAAFLTDYARATAGEVAVWDIRDSGQELTRILVRYRAGDRSFKVARCNAAIRPS